MKDFFNLKGKVAIVTGGNGGIGKGIARGLAWTGCAIVIAARNQTKTEEAVRDIRQEFEVQVQGIEVNVREEASIQAMVEKTVNHFGRVDILVNNAGTNIRKFPQEYSILEWDEILEINLRSVFLCSKAVYPVMKKMGGGKIINVGSMTSVMGGGKLAAYGASKGGVLQLSRSLAVAWAQDNIQVNAILPGWISTDLTIQARKDIAGLHEHVISRTPAGRWGEPDDLIGAAIFLASPSSDFVTGIALPVDGGFSIMI
jgi:2-deoxy-D-gluconate 3-dehydrogenase